MNNEKKVEDIKLSIKDLSYAQLISEQREVAESLRSSYKEDFEFYKSKGFDLVMYKRVNPSVCVDVMESLDYQYIIENNRLFVKLKNDIDFEESVKEFVSLRRKNWIFSALSIIFCVLTAIAITYFSDLGSVEQCNSLSFSLCMISVLFALISGRCLKDSRDIGFSA